MSGGSQQPPPPPHPTSSREQRTQVSRFSGPQQQTPKPILQLANAAGPRESGLPGFGSPLPQPTWPESLGVLVPSPFAPPTHLPVLELEPRRPAAFPPPAPQSTIDPSVWPPEPTSAAPASWLQHLCLVAPAGSGSGQGAVHQEAPVAPPWPPGSRGQWLEQAQMPGFPPGFGGRG